MAYNVATDPGIRPIKGAGEVAGAISVTEPPGDDEISKCQANKVLLLRDRCRLLTETPFARNTCEEMYVSDFDSVTRVIDGVEISVLLPTAPMCRAHQMLCQTHVPNIRVLTLNALIAAPLHLGNNGRPVTECAHHM